MKKLKFLIILFLASFFSACEKDLPINAEFAAYQYASLDENGGTWKPILLTSPDQISIATPEPTTSDAYMSELAEVKNLTENLSDEQRKIVEYWTNNPILRWNEIALELIAKYNLIPGPNDDGSYTLPSSANPAGPPAFPFASPPYACRALAYLSVAQFDGLISAWHYKYQYNRKAPFQVDSSIKTAYVQHDQPSFPADGAVIAAAARDILTAMFPLEKDYLLAKANEHFASLKWAGMNVESDIVAGSKIGSEVATIAKARASNDGMKNAQAPKAVADSIKAAAFAQFNWKWENIETPTRPVGLAPLFGKVQLWNVPDVTLVRPVTPPAPGSTQFEADKAELIELLENVTPEHRAIANYWADGNGTYTPPGHWNRIAKEKIISYNMNPLRSARTFAYLNMAMMDGGICCWDAKYYYHYPRPIALIPNFKTILGTPNFPSYTSGHSVFSSAAANVLSYVFPAESTQLFEWSDEAAESRIYGGIHWRFDAEAGKKQGRDVAQYTIAIAQQDGAN